MIKKDKNTRLMLDFQPLIFKKTKFGEEFFMMSSKENCLNI